MLLAGASVPAAAADAPSCQGLPATIVGTPGDDVITGTPGPDVIVGLDGRDEIHARAGDDVVCAGPGDYFVLMDSDSLLPDLVWGTPGTTGSTARPGWTTWRAGTATTCSTWAPILATPSRRTSGRRLPVRRR